MRTHASPHDAVRALTAEIVTLLAAGELSQIDQMTNRQRLDAHDLAAELSEYPHQIAPTPADEIKNIRVIDQQRESATPPFGSESPGYAVVAEIWTKNNGKSDLSLELTVWERGGGQLGVEIENLHTM